MAAESGRNPFVIWTFFALGFILVLSGYVLRFAVNDGQPGVFDSAAIAAGISFLASILVFYCQTHYERPKTIVETIIGERIIKIVHGHERIYDEYKKELEHLVEKKGVQTVRTIASVPPSETVAKAWDDFLCRFLASHPDVTYKRVVVKQESEEWKRRLREIESRYLHRNPPLDNYTHYQTKGPPSIECLLVGSNRAFITFASSAAKAEESWGLLISDDAICSALEHYFENQLVPCC